MARKQLGTNPTNNPDAATKKYVDDAIGATGSGDVSSNTASSVDSEIAVFSGTGGKTLKRATGSGIAKLTSGVLSAVTAPSGAIVGDTDSQTLTNKTLTTPTIGDFTNATHTHVDAAHGGQLNLTTAANATGTPSSSTYLRGDNTWAVVSAGTATPTASTTAQWDSNTNMSADAFIPGTASTATAAGITTLTINDKQVQVFTGSTTQTVKLPTTSIVAGQTYTIINQSSGAVTVQSSGANTIATQAANTVGVYTAETATPTGAGDWAASVTVKGKVLTVDNSLELAGTDGTTMTFPGSSDTVTTIAATQTLTNKRITKRVSTTASSATPTINTDNVDVYGLTAQAADITSFTTNLTGSPTDGQTLWIYIVGTATRAIAWGSSFEASTVALPTTTVSTNRLDVGFVWNAATSKWRCIAVA